MTFRVRGQEVDADKNVILELAKEAKENRVCMDWNDLKVMFKIFLTANEDSMASIPVTKNVFKQMGHTMDELFELARQNTRRLFPPVIGDMFFFKVLSNDRFVKGAGTILYDDILEYIEKEIDGDFYLIPSSVHEWLLVPDDGEITADVLGEMLREVNEKEVAPEERLANHPYHCKDGEIVSVVA